MLKCFLFTLLVVGGRSEHLPFRRNLKTEESNVSRPIRFLHVSGSGGRSMAAIAKKCGLRVNKNEPVASTMPCQNYWNFLASEFAVNTTRSLVEMSHDGRTRRKVGECNSLPGCDGVRDFFVRDGPNYGSTDLFLTELKTGQQQLCFGVDYVVRQAYEFCSVCVSFNTFVRGQVIIRRPIDRIFSELTHHRDASTNLVKLVRQQLPLQA
jgi:hypothetical protein